MIGPISMFDIAVRLRGIAWYVRSCDRGFDHDAAGLEAIATDLDKIRNSGEQPTRGRAMKLANEMLGCADHLKLTAASMGFEAAALRSLGTELQGLAVRLRSTGEWPAAELKAGAPSDEGGPPADPNAETARLGRAPLIDPKGTR